MSPTKQKTKNHQLQKQHTYAHKHTARIKNNPRYPQLNTKGYKGDHSPLGSTNTKFPPQRDHPHKYNPRYQQLQTKEIKEKKKRKEGWNDHTRLGAGCT